MFWFLYVGCTLAPPGEYDWTVCVRRRCSFFSNYYHLLWPPYGIGQAIIFLPCGFFYLSSFFHCLISAVGDSARRKYRTQKWCKKSPSGHHRTTLSGYIFTTKACIDNPKKELVKWQYVLHMSSEYSELQPINGWDLLVSLGHSSKFQWFSRFGFVTAATSLNRSRPKFALCSAVSWPGILYIHFRQLVPWRNFAMCKIYFVSSNASWHKFVALYIRN